MFGFLKWPGSITRIALDPPAALPGRAGLAIVLIVRNEERHIGEWARFHALAGAAHFYVYDNGCRDGTLAALRAALPEGVLTLLPWDQVLRDARSGREIHNQVLAYAHATRNFGARWRWMAFIDTDEFLVPVKADDLPGALAHLAACRNISLPWHMFGRSGHLVPPAGGMVANYLRRAADPMSNQRGVRNFKCIVDPCHVTGIGVHAIETDAKPETCNDKGEVFTHSSRNRRAFYSAAHLQLNHYYARSEAEVAEKIGRGVFPSTKITGHGRRVRRIVANIETDEVEDHVALDWLARRQGVLT